MALKSIPYTQTADRLLNQIQSYIIQPLNQLITSFNSKPVSSASVAIGTTSLTYINTGLTANFSATGRPIRIELLPSGIPNMNSYIVVNATGATINVGGMIRILRDTTVISTNLIELTGASSASLATIIPVSSISFVDDSAPVGPHQYSVQFAVVANSNIAIVNAILRVSEE